MCVLAHVCVRVCVHVHVCVLSESEQLLVTCNRFLMAALSFHH